MGGSGRNAIDGTHDAAPPEFNGVASFLQGFGLRMIEAADDTLAVRSFILNDDGVIARIEQTEYGSLAWFGHWRGGTNAGNADALDDVLQAVVRHFTRTVGRTPWRLLAWPSAMVETTR